MFMKEAELLLEKKNLKVNLGFLKKDLLLTISLILAVVSSFLYPPKLEYINFHVLVSLFNLMVVIKFFEELKVLDKFAVSLLNKSDNSRAVSMILIGLCFVSSMVFTNDVALLTFVPLTLLISVKSSLPMMETIIFETIAANIGSSLTPMGNPQNLFIYSYFDLAPIPFFVTVLSLAGLGVALLVFIHYKIQNQPVKINLTPIKIDDPKKAWLWGLVLILIILSIFGFIHYVIAFIITLIAALFFNKRVLTKVDYSLLITFVCFFIFVGNISNAEIVHSVLNKYLHDSTSVFFSSILLSQFISNVPASILLANFTTDWKPLLLGVNIGGLGTLIASLASIISYKLYIKANPADAKRYIVKFSIYNFSFLAFLTLVHYFIIKLI